MRLSKMRVKVKADSKNGKYICQLRLRSAKSGQFVKFSIFGPYDISEGYAVAFIVESISTGVPKLLPMYGDPLQSLGFALRFCSLEIKQFLDSVNDEYFYEDTYEAYTDQLHKSIFGLLAEI